LQLVNRLNVYHAFDFTDGLAKHILNFLHDCLLQVTDE